MGCAESARPTRNWRTGETSSQPRGHDHGRGRGEDLSQVIEIYQTGPNPLLGHVALILTKAAVALLPLAGLTWGDPGVILRSPATCLPLPQPVVERPAAGESVSARELVQMLILILLLLVLTLLLL